MKIDVIPTGKENKVNKQTLMYKAKISNEDKFKDELAELKQNYIILFDDGYYRPNTKEDYENFIEKCCIRKNETQNLIEMAKKEMEELN